MSGHRPWSEIRNRMTPEQRARVEKLVERYKKQMARAKHRARRRKPRRRASSL